MMDLVSEIRSLLEEFYGSQIQDFQLELRISEDLKIDGDDALDLISEYSRRFKVDISSFEYHNYFSKEGFNPIGFISYLIGIKKYKPLTIKDLVEGVKLGALNLH
jgi:acyl carrier protein